MTKPKIIIADTDTNYIIPLQASFVYGFFEKIELEIITDKTYFNTLFSTPQKAEILVVSEDLYNLSLQKHNIEYIFLLTEQYKGDQTVNLNVNLIFKYTSITNVLNEIIGKSGLTRRLGKEVQKETQVIVVYSAAGGVGKTTVAMGLSASLTKNYKRVLYINAAHLQVFQHLLENNSPIDAADVYAKLALATDNLYSDIKHVIRKELFSYLPPFKAAPMSLGLNYSIFEKIILSAKKSTEYDFIIVDTDTTFDEKKASLLSIANKVLIITKQDLTSVFATNILVSNINEVDTEKYIFICNNFDKDEENVLVSPHIPLKFTIDHYVDHFRYCENMNPDDLSQESNIQKIAFLIT